MRTSLFLCYARLLAKVEKGPTPFDCWVWVASDNGRYGCFTMNGVQLGAHRASYELFYGKSPGCHEVMHLCNNPKCVNPWHLELGSPQDNADYCVESGNTTAGEKHAMSVLTWDKVRTIRASRGSKSQRALAAEYGIHQSTVWSIQAGRLWKERK